MLCPYCKNLDIVKSGKKKNKSGVKQRYQCNKCKRHFIERDGFERMRFSPETITRAVHQYVDGLPSSKVKNHLQQHDNIKVSRWTICKWTKKYSDLIQKGTKKLKPKIKGDVKCDETYLKIKKKEKYYFESIDKKTKFAIGGHLGHKRDFKNAKFFLVR